ncbi:MAG TPA: phosphate-starvation-inducible PsiE family protein [Candidatus Brocadiaceae bacterium]|nr:phosphate-starvation-inducible PsiE family protein [Candidatus Brocadiaceae bacterium]
MKLEVSKKFLNDRGIEFNSSAFYEKLVRLILIVLILTIISGMLGGVVITILHLRLLFTIGIEHALRVIIIDALTILAVLEIFRTTLAYFSEGRVKVTYIIDTAIVVMVTEIMACLFKEFDLYKMGMLAFLVLILCVMRIFTVKYSPSIKYE